MGLLCLDFTKMNRSEDRLENILVMTDAISNLMVAVVTSNPQTKTFAKALVDRWFYTYGISPRIHSDRDNSFNNKIIEQLCKL